VGFVFGVAGVWLSVRQNIWTWPVGLVNVTLYFFIFLRAGFYSDTGLQVVYFVLLLYGWYHWRFGGPARGALPVTRTPVRTWTLLAVGGAVIWFVLGTVTAQLRGATLPFLDAATTTVSLVAQYMMTRKYLEAWAVWIAVDIVYVGMWLSRSLYLTAVLYAVYLALAVVGHREWKRSHAQASFASS
jgi:nicotinamide mononucleotide transporter